MSIAVLRPCTLLALMLLASPLSATTPANEKLSAEKMWSLTRLGETALSPDGSIAVVTVTRFDIEKDRSATDLWWVPVTGDAARRPSARPLTSDPAADTAPVFSPDGRWIAFVSKRDDDEAAQIYVIPVDGGEAKRVTNVPTGAGAPKWFPDSRRIAFVSAIWTDLVRWKDQEERRDSRKKSKMTAKVWDRAPIADWDRYLDDREPHLFLIDMEGGEPQAVTRASGFHLSKSEYSSDSYSISPDGEEIAFESNVDQRGTAPNYDVIVISSCGCKPARNITAANPADDGAPSYSPDGRWLAFTSQSIPGFYADRRRLQLLERSTGSVQDLSGSFDRSVSALRWRADSKALYSTIDDAATNRIYRFDIASPGQPRRITDRSSFGSLSVAGAIRKPVAVALRQTFSEPPVLVRVDLDSGRVTTLADFNKETLANVKLGRVDSVSYPGYDDVPIQMWVVYPPDFDPSKKYPVFMLLHGGPHNAIQDAVQWRWNAHVFASWGYIVSWHNFHGSSGFGQDFADSINPDRITRPYEDTIRAARWLAAQPGVDPERMVAGGGSYGGFLASTLLGRAHPFKALIAHAAVYNNFTQIAADYGAEQDRFFEFWERPEEFARYSPHTFAANFATPTLVIHGQNDLRVPVNQGMELFNTLQKRGVPSRYVYYPDENHWILKPQNSLFWYKTVRDWVERYAPPAP